MSAHLLIVASPYEAEILRRAAVHEGYRVTVCDTGQAPKLLLREHADAAIVSSAVASPADLCARLRAQEGGPGLCILTIGVASEHADAMVPRPIDPDLVLRRLGSLLRSPPQALPASIEDGATPSQPGSDAQQASIDDALDGELHALWSSMVTPRPEEQVTDPGEVPPWRATTQVLPARAAAPRPQEPGPTIAPAPAATPPPVPATPEEDGAFARRVKNTLSAIEQRLFPDTPPAGFPTPPVEDALGEIDLDALDLAAMAMPEFEVTFDDEQVATPSVPPAVAERAREAIVQQTNILPVRRPAAPAEPPPVEPPPSEPPPSEPPGGSTDVIAATALAQTSTPPSVPPPEAQPATAQAPAVGAGGGPATAPAVSAAAAPAPVPAPAPHPPPERGQLAATDLAQLLHRIRRDGLTGRLRLRRADLDKSIFFEDGIPVFATSNLPHDRLGDLLFREGKITRGQYEESRRVVEESGRRMASVLVDLKLLKPQELFPTVRRQVEDIIYSLFAWTDGEFELSAGEEPPKSQKVRLGAHPDALILEGIRRKLGLERLIERVGGDDTILHPLSADLPAALVDAGLHEPEQRTVALIDGQRTLGDLRVHSSLDEAGVYQLAYALVALGLARAQRPSPRSALSRAEPERDRSIDRDRILAKHALADEGDYFKVLGVHRDATEYEIRRAYEAACREYAPESFPPDLAAEHATELAVIAQVLREAYAVLGNPALRSAYCEHLGDPGA